MSTEGWSCTGTLGRPLRAACGLWPRALDGQSRGITTPLRAITSRSQADSGTRAARRGVDSHPAPQISVPGGRPPRMTSARWRTTRRGRAHNARLDPVADTRHTPPTAPSGQPRAAYGPASRATMASQTVLLAIAQRALARLGRGPLDRLRGRYENRTSGWLEVGRKGVEPRPLSRRLYRVSALVRRGSPWRLLIKCRRSERLDTCCPVRGGSPWWQHRCNTLLAP